ncbi:hypothetical protein O0L34_g14381 [Tuta absoluta]|nr:hypothetical protein O0L34_g14381 [Tuta absoluta]
MEILFILHLISLLLASVELRGDKKRYIFFNLTANDYLKRRYDLSHETAGHLLDLDGALRQRFLYTVTSIQEKLISAICSPFSAMMPLGMLLLGAGHEKTDKDLRNAIGMKIEAEAPEYFKDLTYNIQKLPNVHTYLANQIYVSNKKKLKSNFVEAAKDIFGSGVQSINMKDGNKVADEVNNWVRKNTEGKIDQILRPSDVNPDTVVLLVNAIYFSAKWMRPFEYSENCVFYGVDGQQIVNMMHKRDYYMYGTSPVLEAEAVLIPYEEDSAAMLVLLPRAKDGLQSLLLQLKKAPDLINTITVQRTHVELLLPTFKIETSLDLKILYERVGLSEIFNKGHGLHDIVENSTLYIDKGIQKAFIEVTKEGTVAAAASVTDGMTMSMLITEKPVLFRADHPFLFLIIAHKQQLFGGTFAAEKTT